MTVDVTRDVRDLLGMRGREARILVGVYALTCLLLAVYSSAGAMSQWPLVVAALVCTSAAVALITVDGDPMPLGVSVAVMSTGAVASLLVFAVIPVPAVHGIQMWWPMGMSTVVFAFLCVRGRIVLAWIGLLLMIATAALWAEATGQGFAYGVSQSFVNAAPVLMSTVFAYTLRPLARSIYVLRDKSLVRIADEAAAAAIVEERDAQLDRLDGLARPLLERIACGDELGDDERLSSVLLEARLRDGLRAPALQDPVVVDAATAARRRGVDVVMLDDHGLDSVAADEQERIRRQVAVELDAVTGGSVTVRVLPPGRRALVTVLVRGESVRRVEIGHSGAQ